MLNKFKESAEHDNAERWIISYADFITLLFAFFVVMYAISNVQESKYAQLSESMQKAFASGKFEEIDLGVIRGDGSNNIESNQVDISSAYNDIKQDLDGLLADGSVMLRQEMDWIEIELSAGVLFNSGGAYLTSKAELILQKIAKVLTNFMYFIAVEGFTDDIPINNEMYPSNWELSAARSASVVRYLLANGVAEYRLAAIGYGSLYPIANNQDSNGRYKNRRISIVLEKTSKRRQLLGSKTYEQPIVYAKPNNNVDIGDFKLSGEQEFLPKAPVGDSIKGMKQQDGSIKFSKSGLYDKE